MIENATGVPLRRVFSHVEIDVGTCSFMEVCHEEWGSDHPQSSFFLVRILSSSDQVNSEPSSRLRNLRCIALQV